MSRGADMRNNLNLYVKKYNFSKKPLAIRENTMYTNPCCGMIAMKREVAANGNAGWQVFRGANVKLGN